MTASPPWSCDAPTEEQWRALARSSPQLWSTVQLRTYDSWGLGEAVRAYISRGVGQVVEWPNGALCEVSPVNGGTWESAYVHDDAPSFTVQYLSQEGEPGPPAVRTEGVVLGAADTEARYILPPAPTGALLDHRSRNSREVEEPMFHSYRWCSMLDPVELADGYWNHCADVHRTDHHPTTEHEVSSAEPNGVTSCAWCTSPDQVDSPVLKSTILSDITVGIHRGRRVWEALVTPTYAYRGKCGCCCLVHHLDTDLPVGCDVADATSATGFGKVPTHCDEAQARFAWAGVTPAPEARPYVVRLDEVTGICVWSALAKHAEPLEHDYALDLNRGVPVIDVEIEAVDLELPEPLPTTDSEHHVWRERLRSTTRTRMAQPPW